MPGSKTYISPGDAFGSESVIYDVGGSRSMNAAPRMVTLPRRRQRNHLPSQRANTGSKSYSILRSNLLPSNTSSFQATISSAPAELGRYDAEIHKLQIQFNRLIADRRILASYADKCHGVFSPIRRLPPELLADIFELCLPRETYQLSHTTTLSKKLIVFLAGTCFNRHKIIRDRKRAIFGAAKVILVKTREDEGERAFGIKATFSGLKTAFKTQERHLGGHNISASEFMVRPNGGPWAAEYFTNDRPSNLYLFRTNINGPNRVGGWGIRNQEEPSILATRGTGNFRETQRNDVGINLWYQLVIWQRIAAAKCRQVTATEWSQQCFSLGSWYLEDDRSLIWSGSIRPPL
ncbi:hypothetical protein B0H14DRAFT_2592358 [Mycena olivaceomarginata]|nr:hypothetical protein B0H14DRAFT_2592358 [Mycena olivaceomarginata]